MRSQSIAGFLGAVIAAVVLAAAFYYVPVGPAAKPAQSIKVDMPVAAQPAPAPGVTGSGAPGPGAASPRGPIVRDVPN